MKTYLKSLFLFAILPMMSFSCDKEGATPGCVKGVVVGSSCDGGTLIHLYEREKVGKKITYRGPEGNREEEFDNVVGTFSDLHGLHAVGGEIFLNYRLADPAEVVSTICNANVITYSWPPQIIVFNIAAEKCPDSPLN
jgi:hypothetical protein